MIVLLSKLEAREIAVIHRFFVDFLLHCTSDYFDESFCRHSRSLCLECVHTDTSYLGGGYTVVPGYHLVTNNHVMQNEHLY